MAPIWEDWCPQRGGERGLSKPEAGPREDTAQRQQPGRAHHQKPVCWHLRSGTSSLQNAMKIELLFKPHSLAGRADPHDPHTQYPI